MYLELSGNRGLTKWKYTYIARTSALHYILANFLVLQPELRIKRYLCKAIVNFLCGMLNHVNIYKARTLSIIYYLIYIELISRLFC